MVICGVEIEHGRELMIITITIQNTKTNTMTKTNRRATLVDACGMESRGRKEVLDKEEMGQEVELLHELACEQMCCRGKGQNYMIWKLRDEQPKE